MQGVEEGVTGACQEWDGFGRRGSCEEGEWGEGCYGDGLKYVLWKNYDGWG